MDTMIAFRRGQANRYKESMVFDWDKAAEIIKERKPNTVEAGLEGDWEWTGGPIYSKGKPVPKEDTYTYLSSTWATPLLMVDGESIPCFIMASKTNWSSDTYWPESSLSILKNNP